VKRFRLFKKANTRRRFAIEHHAPHFLPGVFAAQNIGTVPFAKLIRRLGHLSQDKLA